MATTRRKTDGQTRKELYLEIGRALAEWARLEEALFEMFRWVMHIEWAPNGSRYKMARAVFYSSRSFLGRSDMLLAALKARDDCELCEPTRQLIKAITLKAIAYNGTRNVIAHSTVAYSGSSVVWASPKTSIDVVGLGHLEMRTAAANFGTLSKIATAAAFSYHPKSQRTQKCLDDVQALPKLAHEN